MICLLALIVFSILGIFSATHRKLAVEAFDCVFRRVTFRKCTSALDERVKSQIIGKLMVKSPKVAGFTFKHFEFLSWCFTVLLILSTIYTVYAGYNYYMYGNCNGENSDAFCIFDPTKEYNSISEVGGTCFMPEIDPATTLKKPVLTGNYPSIKGNESKIKIIEFGCFSCPYTKQTSETVKKVIENYGKDIEYIFIDFPLQTHNLSTEAAMSAECVREQGEDKYWMYVFKLLDYVKEFDNETIVKFALETGVENNTYLSCYSSQKYKSNIENDISIGFNSKIYGTPTFFIGDQTIVGPKPYRIFKRIINEEINKNEN